MTICKENFKGLLKDLKVFQSYLGKHNDERRSNADKLNKKFERLKSF